MATATAVAVPIVWRKTTTQAIHTQSINTAPLDYMPRVDVDTGGYDAVKHWVLPWSPEATLEQLGRSWRDVGLRAIREIDRSLEQRSQLRPEEVYSLLGSKVGALNYEGQPGKAYEALKEARKILESSDLLASEGLYTLIFLQGVTALCQGETEDCVMCRGESSYILPISLAARHINPEGSRREIEHFTEYLTQFPNDLEVRWLLNIAHMTLGEHPDRVDPQFLIPLDHFVETDFSIGRFRDIGHVVGVNKFKQAGGRVSGHRSESGNRRFGVPGGLSEVQLGHDFNFRFEVDTPVECAGDWQVAPY
jgi:hypothetical protein